MIYSTVTEYFGYGVLPYLHFTLSLSSPNLLTPVYSVYQQSLYDKITSLREKGMNFVQIANWLNTKGYKTPRGRIFRNNHVHSIVKKRRNHLDIIQKEPTQSLSNISLRYKKRPWITLWKNYYKGQFKFFERFQIAFSKTENYTIIIQCR